MSTAESLLRRCQAADVTLVLDPPDTIVVSGPADARARLLPEIREAKPALVALLAARQEAVAEAQAERAAIMEVDGGMSRVRAQEVAELAGAYYSHHWTCPACRHGTQVGAAVHRPCAEGAALWQRYCEAARLEVKP